MGSRLIQQRESTQTDQASTHKHHPTANVWSYGTNITEHGRQEKNDAPNYNSLVEPQATPGKL